MPTNDQRETIPVGSTGGKSGWSPGADYEHNAELRDHRTRVDKMRACRTHWSVVAGEALWRGLLHLPTWRMACADEEEPQAVAYRDHADACMGVSGPGTLGDEWGTRLDETGDAALYGYGVWAKWAERGPDGAWYARAESREQGSIIRWVTDGRKLLAVEQIPQAMGPMISMPADRLVLATYRPQAPDDYTGNGVLRPVIPLYGDAVRYHAAYAAGAQRWSMPTPMVRFNMPAAVECRIEEAANFPGWFAFIQAELAKWDSVAKALVGHERAHLAPPPWIVFEKYGGELGTGLDQMQGSINSTDRRILTVLGGGVLMLGTENAGGTQALSSTLYDSAQDSAASLCAWVSRVWAPFIKSCVEWQFGPVDPRLLPHLQADGLTSEAFIGWVKSGAFAPMVTAGLITMDAPLEAAIRRAGEMPPADPSTARRTPRAPGAVVLPGGRQ